MGKKAMAEQAWWNRVRSEWRANQRLRLAALVALVILAAHGLSSLDARTEAHRKRHADDLELQARLEGLRKQDDWSARAEEAATRLQEMRQRMPEVSSAGLAQAELQNWLGELAASNAMAEPRIRVEETLDVPGHPEMWQVLARLDGQIPQYGQAAFLRAVSEALPWIQVERIEIDDSAPARLNLVVRGYYRRAQPPAQDAAVQPEGGG